MAQRLLRLLPVVLLAGASAQARAGSADIEGTISYSIDGDRITVEIERIANNTSNITTGSLYVTVWMTTTPDLYVGGYQVARHRITGSSNGQLEPGHYFSDIRWTLDYQRPPAGTYYVHFFTSEHPEPNTVLDSRTFTNTLEVAGGRADIEGRIAYTIEGGRITVEIERIANNTSGTTTGTLYVTVRMTVGADISSNGYRVARHRITGNSNGQLEPGHHFSDIRWTLDYQAPPPGTYYVHFYTSEHPEPNTSLDSRTFSKTQSVGGGSGGGDDHGNSRATATNIAVPGTASGRIDPATEEDYFRFVLSSAANLVARTSGDLDTLGTLYDAGGERLAEDDDGASVGLNFRIERQLAAGTYFVAVGSYQGVGNYTLHLSVADADSGSPDLVVESPTVSVGEVARGGQFVLAATVRNRGNAQSAASTVRYFRERSDGTRVRRLGEQSIAALDPSATQAVELRVNAEAAAGTYTYSVCVASVAGESDTSNNCSSSVSVVVQPPPDSGVPAASERVLGDFDGDGRADVLLRHADGRWFFYPMNGRQHSTGEGTANLTQNLEWTVAGVGDLNGDGKDDVLLRKPTTGTWYYYPMDGRRHLTGHGAADLPSDLAWSLAGIGDFDGNGRDDVLLRHDDGRWYFYPMEGRRQATGHGTANLTQNLEWDVAGIGDLNGDGKDDVLLRKPTTGTWYYYPMNGRRHLAGHGAANLPSDLAWSLAGIGDFDGNGRDDVLLRHDDGRWYFHAMDGRRQATGHGAANLTRNLEWDVTGIGDLNGDGKDDVLLRKPTTGTWYYYPMNGRRHLTGHGASNLTSDLDWALASAGASARGLRVSTSIRSSVQPFQSIALNVGGGANDAEYDIIIDLSGTGGFEAEHTIEAVPVKAAGGGLLMAAPLSETLAEGNTARHFSVRVRERGDETMSNTLSFTLGETNVPPSLAGHPTVILDVVLKAVYEGLDDPLLTVEAGAIEPGRSVRTARALGLSTAYSDAQAEALLRSLFGASLVAPSASTSGPRTAMSAGYRGAAVRCEVLAPDALCNAYRGLADCVGDAMRGFGVRSGGEDSFGRCTQIVKDDIVEGWLDYGEKINTVGNGLRSFAPRVARFLGFGRRPAQAVLDINAAVRQGVGLNKTVRAITEDAETLQQTFEALRDTTRTFTEDLPDHIAATEQEAVADGVDDDERDAHFALVEEADHHYSDAAVIEELEDVYTGEADVEEVLGTMSDGGGSATGGGTTGGATCASGYEEFPVDDKTSTCVWNSLVEWNCYAGSRHVSHPDLGGANACLYYSLDYVQSDSTCRENYAKVTFLGRETCRWAELGADKVAWYTLEKEYGVESPQTPAAGMGGGNNGAAGQQTPATSVDGGDGVTIELPGGHSIAGPNPPDIPAAPSGVEVGCSGDRDASGARAGRWVCAFRNGSSDFATYEAGVLNGESGSYNSDGEPRGAWGSYEDGDRQGVWWFFYSNGSSDFSTYEAGVLNGESGGYNSDGEPRGAWGSYEDGDRQGVWWFFYSNGSSDFSTYEAGVLNGESGGYNSDGEKVGCWRSYTNGEPGPGTFYYSNGSTGTC